MSAAPGFETHPDYEVQITPAGRHIRVLVGDTVIAESTDAVTVLETKHRPVYYLPWADLDESRLSKTDTDTYCPFKGHASYWSVTAGGETVEDAIWSYEQPYDECLSLKAYASFYTNKVDVEVDGKVIDRDGPGWVRDR